MHIKILAVLSIVAVFCIILGFSLNVVNIEDKNRNVEAYHDYTPYLGLFTSLILLLSGLVAMKIHFVVGVIPFGLGLAGFLYHLYILIIKLGWL
jgi:hypothetical protein